MGIFDFLFGSKKTDDEVELNNLNKNEAKKANNIVTNPVTSTNVKMASVYYKKPRKSLSETKATVDTANLLRERLSSYTSYEIKEDYSFAGEDAQNASFALFKDGSPKLYIMIIDNNTCCTHAYLAAKRSANSSGVKILNFAEHLPNEVDYVDNRLADNLKD